MATDFISEAYVAHREQLRRYLVSMTRDEDLAEDLVQDTYARLALEVSLGRTPTNTGAWLRRVGRNLVIDRARRQRIAFKVQGGLRPDTVAPSAEQEVTDREDRLELDRLLSEVGVVNGAALRMAAAGYSGAETAHALGISEAAVRTRISRSRGRLRTLLAAVL